MYTRDQNVAVFVGTTSIELSLGLAMLRNLAECEPLWATVESMTTYVDAIDCWYAGKNVAWLGIAPVSKSVQKMAFEGHAPVAPDDELAEALAPVDPDPVDAPVELPEDPDGPALPDDLEPELFDVVVPPPEDDAPFPPSSPDEGSGVVEEVEAQAATHASTVTERMGQARELARGLEPRSTMARVFG
jgi:hypothetical protein